MIAIDSRLTSRTKGQALDIPGRVKRRFDMPTRRSDRLRKRDVTIYRLRTRDGYSIADLAAVFGLSQSHLKSILADVSEHLMALADDE